MGSSKLEPNHAHAQRVVSEWGLDAFSVKDTPIVAKLCTRSLLVESSHSR
jgi:hypothetical protein